MPLPLLTPAHFPDYQLNHELPETVLQFGTGALLRGLVDAIIDESNQGSNPMGRVVAVASTQSGRSQALNDQRGMFTHVLEGKFEGETVQKAYVNTGISRVLPANTDWDAVMEVAKSPALKWVISNTTEIGIQYHKDDLQAGPPQSFPAKLTAVLWKRYRAFEGDPSKGLVILPTELITDNGQQLKRIVQKQVEDHQLSPAFWEWVETSCVFCNTLVDRIVTGTPGPERVEELQASWGYTDHLITVSEPYALWAIEAPEKWHEHIGFSDAQKGVILSEDIQPYRERKLRILNGTHTFCVALGFLRGLTTVREMMEDDYMSNFVKRIALEEIPASLEGEVTDAESFAKEVLERFTNPYLDHKLLDICFQYTTKMKARNLLSIHRYIQKQGKVPLAMVEGFAAYLHFLRPREKAENSYYGMWNGNRYPINDAFAEQWMQLWEEYSDDNPEKWLHSVLQDQSLWGEDLTELPGFASEVEKAFVSWTSKQD
ncbi:MAG: tagaturonate reductase [Bacteroidota bacterium]